MTQSTSSAITEDYIDDNWSVSIAPITISLLTFDTLKADYFKEGFLIGELKEMSEVVPISDDVKKPYIRRYKTLYIKSFLPWPTFLRFYDGYGRVVPEKVASLLGDLLPNVVGWYRCRPFPGTMITNRETMIQQHLRSLVPLLPKYFVFCLVIKNEAGNGNPLSFDHKFFNYDSRRRVPTIVPWGS
ncbi:uncharacterized protein LOC135128571 [Zophobas morio]|uniref:uncharacterized protein LOC135128571 n=1 Tax=Zophobas morio TaxID=2755281 RepID=UPI00308295EA